MGSSQDFAVLPIRDERPDRDLQKEPHSVSIGDYPDAPSVSPREGHLSSPRLRSRFERIGRYRVERTIDCGSFSTVYLCADEELNRQVAVKVIDPAKLPPGDQSWKAEAHILGQLDHPSIVPVYDAGLTTDWQPFVVSKFMVGGSLKQVVASRTATVAWCATVVADIADALHHAHGRKLVHRDIKPGNILLDDRGKAHLADFGIALRDDNFGRGAEFVGTVPYMSPEQARGEGHRVDARSDLFGLGSVFFELLFGYRLFVADTRQKTLDAICGFDPESLEVSHGLIPEEVVRVLRRMLAPRLLDRYPTGAAVAEDLRAWLRTTPDANAIAVLPSAEAPADSLASKGLFAFGERDAKAFLELVPGARGADGVPDMVRFWIDRLDLDPLEMRVAPPAVGFMYGPSGCGKSSLVAAGILPRLSPLVRRVIVDCGVSDPVASLTKLLGPASPGDATEHSTTSNSTDLPSSIASIRRNAGRKTVIVLDQFEQWLARWNGAANHPLVTGLRQCDGRTVQALVLVRDDFWTSTQRFLRELDMQFSEGVNATFIEGFTANHARKVLLRLGRTAAAGAADSATISQGTDLVSENPDVASFVNAAVAELSLAEPIVAARIALLLEAVGDLPWSTATYEKIGGVGGSASHLLESTFGVTSPPSQSRHRRAAMRLLEALVPADATQSLKGAAVSESDLMEASGYRENRDDFRDLMNLLENRLKFVAAGDAGSSMADTVLTVNRQLTHDYLVYPLRAWIAADREVGWFNRRERRLDLLSRAYAAAPESRNLPAWYEWPILTFIHFKSNRTFTRPARSKLLRRAHRHYGAWLTLVTAATLLAAELGINAYRRARGRELALGAISAEAAALPRVLSDIREYESFAEPFLRAVLETDAIDGRPLTTKERIRARLVLLRRDGSQLPAILAAAIDSEVEELGGLLPTLRDHSGECEIEIWRVAKSAEESPRRRLNAACAAARFFAEDKRWPDVAADIALLLSQVELSHSRPYIELLSPARAKLCEPLTGIFRQRPTEESGAVATVALGMFFRDDFQPLVDLALTASDRQLRLLRGAFALDADRAVQLLETALHDAQLRSSTESLPAARYRAPANAIVLLAALGREEHMGAALGNSIDPTIRSHIMLSYAAVDLGFEALLRSATKPAQSAAVRFGRLLCIGPYVDAGLTNVNAKELTQCMTDLYRHDPDSGVHSAAGWLLEKQLGEGATNAMDREFLDDFLKNGRKPGWGWYVVPNLHTMAIHRALDKKTSFAVATKETTIEQFLNFKANHECDRSYASRPAQPVNKITIGDAYSYVEWLSGLKGDALKKPQLARVASVKWQWMEIFPPDRVGWRGYRLPAKEEWTLACKAGSETRWSFGDDPGIGASFVLSMENRKGGLSRAGALPPNSWGLFEVHGNVTEISSLHREKNRQGDICLGASFMGGGLISTLDGTRSSASTFEAMPSGMVITSFQHGFRIAQSMDDD